MERNGMPAMTDPMDALTDFRRAIRQREIHVQPADFHPDVFVHVDQPPTHQDTPMRWSKAARSPRP